MLTPTSRNLILRERDLRSYLALIVRVDAKNYTTVEDFYQRNAYFFKPIVHSDLEPGYHNQSFIYGVPILDLIKAAKTISQVHTESWNTTSLHNKISENVTSFTKAGGLLNDDSSGAEERPSDVAQRVFSKALHSYLRWALAGGMPGPSIADIMAVLGRSTTLDRLNDAAESFREHGVGSLEAEVPQSEAIASN